MGLRTRFLTQESSPVRCAIKILRVLAWLSEFTSIVVCAIAVCVDDKNPHIRLLWQVCGISGLAGFAILALVGWFDARDAKAMQAEIERLRSQSEKTIAARIEDGQPWHIDNAQLQGILRPAISDCVGQKFEIQITKGDVMAGRFAGFLSSQLTFSKWTPREFITSGISNVEVFFGLGDGVEISLGEYKNIDLAPELVKRASNLADALCRCGIPIRRAPNRFEGGHAGVNRDVVSAPATIVIRIGRKPPVGAAPDPPDVFLP
jgi:hypothetical protein